MNISFENINFLIYKLKNIKLMIQYKYQVNKILISSKIK